MEPSDCLRHFSKFITECKFNEKKFKSIEYETVWFFDVDFDAIRNDMTRSFFKASANAMFMINHSGLFKEFHKEIFVYGAKIADKNEYIRCFPRWAAFTSVYGCSLLDMSEHIEACTTFFLAMRQFFKSTPKMFSAACCVETKFFSEMPQTNIWFVRVKDYGRPFQYLNFSCISLSNEKTMNAIAPAEDFCSTSTGFTFQKLLDQSVLLRIGMFGVPFTSFTFKTFWSVNSGSICPLKGNSALDVLKSFEQDLCIVSFLYEDGPPIFEFASSKFILNLTRENQHVDMQALFSECHCALVMLRQGGVVYGPIQFTGLEIYAPYGDRECCCIFKIHEGEQFAVDNFLLN